MGKTISPFLPLYLLMWRTSSSRAYIIPVSTIIIIINNNINSFISGNLAHRKQKWQTEQNVPEAVNSYQHDEHTRKQSMGGVSFLGLGA